VPKATALGLAGAASLLIWSLTIVSSRLIPNNWFK
jgi:hypothetical protein